MSGIEHNLPDPPTTSMPSAHEYLAQPENRSKFDAFIRFYNEFCRDNDNLVAGLSAPSQEIVVLSQVENQPRHVLRIHNVLTGLMTVHDPETGFQPTRDFNFKDSEFGYDPIRLKFHAQVPIDATITVGTQGTQWRSRSTDDQTVELGNVLGMPYKIAYEAGLPPDYVASKVYLGRQAVMGRNDSEITASAIGGEAVA